MKNFLSNNTLILIAITGGLFFIPFLGMVHLFDWDELNFAEAAREMLVTGNYFRVQIDYVEFSDKPPLFIWMQALSMSLLGVTEFAARLPNALIGIASLIVLFQLGKKLVDKSFGLLWVMAYTGSLLPHFYFKSGIIDPAFNLFIFLGLICLFLQTIRKDPGSRYAILGGLFTGLAILTKGPVGFLLVVLPLVIYMVLSKEGKFNLKSWILFLTTSGLVAFLWFGSYMILYGWEPAREFILYQVRLFTTEDAGHGGPFYYHFLVLLAGCFPASLFLFFAFSSGIESSPQQFAFKKLMIILLLTVLTIFSIVQTKIVHYSSMAYFPITFLAAYGIYKLKGNHRLLKKITALALLLFGFVLALVIILLPEIGSDPELITTYIKDEFTLANLQAKVIWHRWEMIYGVIFLAGVGVGAVLIFKNRLITSAKILFISTALLVFIIAWQFAPRIEKYTQGALVEFFESKQNEDCFVEVIGFKSYGKLFYTRRPEHNLSKHTDNMSLWLRNNDPGKVVYFVCKIDRKEKYFDKSTMELLYEKNGFVFMKKLQNLPD